MKLLYLAATLFISFISCISAMWYYDASAGKYIQEKIGCVWTGFSIIIMLVSLIWIVSIS